MHLMNAQPWNRWGQCSSFFLIFKDDEFADIERFRRYWLRLEPHSKENVFRALPDVYLENAKWRIQCLIEFLANEETYKFASQVLPHSLVFDSNQGFQNQVIELIRSSLGIVSAELFALYSLPRSPQQIENFGWARIYQANASIVPKDALLKLSNQVEKVKLAGFFEVIKCALKYACRHTHESLVELFVILNDSWELLDFLPECIRELIPHTPSCDTSNAVLQAIRLMTPDELAIAMDTPDGRIWKILRHRIQFRLGLSIIMLPPARRIFIAWLRLIQKLPSKCGGIDASWDKKTFLMTQKLST